MPAPWHDMFGDEVRVNEKALDPTQPSAGRARPRVRWASGKLARLSAVPPPDNNDVPSAVGLAPALIPFAECHRSFEADAEFCRSSDCEGGATCTPILVLYQELEKIWLFRLLKLNRRAVFD